MDLCFSLKYHYSHMISFRLRAQQECFPDFTWAFDQKSWILLRSWESKMVRAVRDFKNISGKHTYFTGEETGG